MTRIYLSIAHLGRHEIKMKVLTTSYGSTAPRQTSWAWYMCRVATSLAVLTFNKGLCCLSPLFGQLGGGVGPFCTRYLVANDAILVRKAQAKVTQEVKRRRKFYGGGLF